MITLSLYVFICFIEPRGNSSWVQLTDCRPRVEKHVVPKLPQDQLRGLCEEFKREYTTAFNEDIPGWVDKMAVNKLPKKERRLPIVVQANCDTEVEG